MLGSGNRDPRDGVDPRVHSPRLTVRSAASQKSADDQPPHTSIERGPGPLDDLLSRWNNALREVERVATEALDGSDGVNLGQRLPVRGVPMGSFTRHMGIGETPAAAPDQPVESVLAEVAIRAMRFFTKTMPVGAQLAGEPEWVRQREQRVAQLGAGPRRPTALLGAYLRAEQRQGRIRPDADTDAAAAIVLGACFHAVFLTAYLDDEPGDTDQFARDIAGIVMNGVGASAKTRRVETGVGSKGGDNVLRGPGDRRSYRSRGDA
ncbi:MAG: hypothetical protein WBA31_07110 [Candidatus Dormiibacterota bacterium]